MRTKQEIIERLTEFCNDFNLKVPDFNSYTEVKKMAERFNNSCHFCGKYPHTNGAICSCEFNECDDEFYKD